METTEPTSSKQINFKSNIKSLSSSTSLNNISGDITFTNLKNLAQILCNTRNQAVVLLYEDSEIDINEETATLNEVFEGIDEITIEIKLKETGLTHKNSEKTKNRFPICERHPNEFAKTFCDLCKRNICFRCSIVKEHKAHKNYVIISELQNKSKNVEDKFNEVTKLLKSNGYTKESLNKLKTFHVFKVSTDFDNLFQKLDDIRIFYYDFYTEYFANMDKSLTSLQEDFRKLSIKYNSLTTVLNKNDTNNKNSNSSQSSQNGLSSVNYNNTNFAESLINIENFEKDLNSFLRTLKSYSDLKDIRSELDGDYENYKNSLNHKLEMILAEYFDELKLKKYDRILQTENEDILIKNYLATFVEAYDKIHSRIYMPIPLTKNLIQFDLEWNEFSEILVGKQNYTFRFKNNSKYLNSQDCLFVSGGIEILNSNFDKPSQSCYLISVLEGRILELGNMMKPRSNHSLIYNQKLKIIFAISGYENYSVEIFVPLRNRWFLFKPLNKWRCHANVLFADDQKYMYVFGGDFNKELNSDGIEKELRTGKSSINTLERISIEKLGRLLNSSNFNKFENLESLGDNFDWDVFNLKQPYEGLNMNCNLYGSGVLQLNENKFLVFGGVGIENESEMSDEIRIVEGEKDRKNFKFSLSICNFVEGNDKVIQTLPERCFFHNQNFGTLGEKLLGQFNNSGNLIVFNMDTQKFEVIKNNPEK